MPGRLKLRAECQGAAAARPAAPRWACVEIFTWHRLLAQSAQPGASVVLEIRHFVAFALEGTHRQKALPNEPVLTGKDADTEMAPNTSRQRFLARRLTEVEQRPFH